MFITRILLENFQCHSHFEMALSDGLNILKGKSDKGKSSVIRAIHWLCFNKPASKIYYPFDCEDVMRVTIETVNGDMVSRCFKPNSVNTYVINGKELTGFGRDVPSEVQKVLHINALNFKLQKDQFFLLDFTPSEVTKAINNVLDLSQVESVISKGETERRSLKAEIKVYEKQISELESEKSSLEWSILARESYDRYLDLSAMKDEISGNLDKILDTYEQLCLIKSQLESIEFIVDAFPKYIHAQTETAIALETHKELLSLADIVDKINDIANLSARFDFIHSAQTDYDQYISDFHNINAINDKINSINNTIAALTDIEENIPSTIDSDELPIMYHFPDINASVLDELESLKQKMDSLPIDISCKALPPIINITIPNILDLETCFMSMIEKKKELDVIVKEMNKMESQIQYCDKCGSAEFHWRRCHENISNG